MCKKFEDAVDNIKVFAIIITLGIICNSLTSCSYESLCPSYGQTNHITKRGVKSQQVWAKRNKHLF